MNAMFQSAPVMERLEEPLTEVGRSRLRRRLECPVSDEDVWWASSLFGTCPRQLAELYDHFRRDFRLEEQPVWRLPWFRCSLGERSLRFVHVRSAAPSAEPLLLLHGLLGSPAELAPLLVELARGDACFDLVCPMLEDAGTSSEVRALASAELMRSLGHARYYVHGSDSGSGVALALAAASESSVVVSHVTTLPVFPWDEHWTISLDSAEKSQLAACAELVARLERAPSSPLEELAFALSNLDAEAPEEAPPAESQDALLSAVAFAWATASPRARFDHHAQLKLRAAPPSRAPVSVHTFPQDVPSLRRLAEARHHIVEWREHERGGPWPALEQPRLLADSLRELVTREP